MKLKMRMLAVAVNVCALVVRTAAEAAESHDLTVEPGGLTPHQAQAKIRAAKAAGDKGMWTVRVKPGCYVLPETLAFTPADSGTPKAPVRWIGEGEKCVFSGGEPLKGWKDEGGGVWSAEVPQGKGGRPVYFDNSGLTDAVPSVRVSRTRDTGRSSSRPARKSRTATAAPATLKA